LFGQQKSREFFVVARARVGWDKDNISFGGAFCFAKYTLQIRRKKGQPSEGEAEGGCGGNSASPEPKRSPAALLAKSRTRQKSFLFLLEGKIGRAQIKKCEENFFAGWRASASGGGAERQFRSKKVRAFSNNGHQIGLRDFLWGEAEVCSSRLRRDSLKNWAVKSNGGTKSQETIFLEMRRFVPIFCAKYPASRD